MQIVLEVPDQFLLNDTAESLGRLFKLSAALLMFRTGKISAGAACELAGVDRYSFLQVCKENGVPAADYPPEELDVEMAWLARASTSS